MARAEDLLDRVVEKGEEAIDAFIAERQSEELFLDFKRSADDGKNFRLNNKDRSNLGKAISGFGNSEGGLVVWGVECSDDSTGADVARAKHPLTNPKRFLSWLEGAVSGCTVPPHSGVRHHAVERSDGTGFVVSYVPKSERAPHQTVAPPQYYIRAGSSFSPAPHAVLAGMFGRRPQAVLYHTWSLPPVTVESDSEILSSVASFDVGLNLFNKGPVLARDLYVNIKIYPPGGNSKIAVTPGDAENWTGHHAFGTWTSIVSKDHFKLAPDSLAQALILHFRLVLPFEGGFSYELSFGHGASNISQLTWRIREEELSEAFGALLEKREDDGRVFVRKLLNAK